MTHEGRRAAIIYNPVRTRIDRLRSQVEASETANGFAPSLWLATVENETVDALVARAVEEKVDVVIAAGGDGTVRGVGSAVQSTGIPFGIVPSGTANLLARNLGLPLNDRAAATEIAFGGVNRPIDVGVLDYTLENGTEGQLPYLVMAGFGIDADMVAGADPASKRRFGWAAYVWPIIWALRPRAGVPVTWRIDDEEPTTSKLHSIFLASCGIITAGIKLLPAATMDDGRLDILAIRSVWRWLRDHDALRMPRFRVADNPDSWGDFRYARATRVELTLERPRTFQADGDAIGDVVWARATIRPRATLVRVPATTAG